MKKLFSRLLLFGVISFSIYGFYIVLLAHVFNTNSLYRLPAEKSVLVLGNSHAACDINDTLITGMFNLSHPGDAISNSYEKLKKFLPLNPAIRIVLLSSSEGDITQRNEDDEALKKSLNFHIKNYFYLMDAREFFYLLARKPTETVKSIAGIPRISTALGIRIFRSQAALNDLDLGKYQRIGGAINYDKELKKFARNDYDMSEVSQWQVGYLHKIVDFCKSRNVMIVFVRTPEHKIYVRKNENIYLALLRQQFSDVPFKDYADMDLPDSCFEDHDHLNFYGADRFTDTISAYLNTIQVR